MTATARAYATPPHDAPPIAPEAPSGPITALRHKLIAGGFFPIPVNGKKPTLNDWTEITATAADVARWGECLNTGILTKYTPAIDIDISDPKAADAIESMVRRKFEGRGRLCVRFGRWPRRLIPFRTDEPFKKQSIDFQDKAKTRHAIEILGDGQQFVTAGIHPDTNQPYVWHEQVQLGDIQRAELPHISAREAAEFLAEAERALLKLGYKHGDDTKAGEADAPDADRVPSEPQAEIRRIAAALKVIPNNNLSWDEWNRVAMATFRGTGGSPEGLDAFDGWSRKATAKYDAGRTQEKWDAMRKSPPKRIGAGTLFHLADKTNLSWDPPFTKSREGDGTASECDARPLIKSSAQFVAGFVAPEYVLVGLLIRRFLYSLTGQTGAGKTCITLRLAASVALGVEFGGRVAQKCRVLYAAAENPDDVRMRWIALSQHMGFDPATIEVYFTEGTFSISKSVAKLRADAEAIGGEFGLVIVDTGPAFFEGDDENSRPQMGAHARMMRGLINIIPGGPTVLVNCHPIKNATADNLLPAGGGSFLNEVDGNLTCAKNESLSELHWLGKFRGPEFAPMNFLLKTVTHQDLKDSEGRLLPTVICECLTEQSREEM